MNVIEFLVAALAGTAIGVGGVLGLLWLIIRVFRIDTDKLMGRMVLIGCAATLFSGCAVRTPEGYEVTIGDAHTPIAPAVPTITQDAVDARIELIWRATAFGEFLWKAWKAFERGGYRDSRQHCADAMEHARAKERMVGTSGTDLAFKPAKGERPDLGQDTPAVAGVRERADEAFWQELER